jgi:branched-chain amino acid transport system permease protein
MYFVELFVIGLIDGSTYAMMAVGLTLVYGLLRILHIAHAGVFTLGAYITVHVTNATGSLALALLVSAALAGLFGMAIYRLVYQPILDQPPFVALIASIGLFICLEEAFRLVFGPYGESFADPPLRTTYDLAGITVNAVQIAIVASAVILIGGLGLIIGRTRIGVAWRATVSSPQMAESFGVDTIKVRYLNFFIGSALAAVAGSLIALLNNFVEPTMGSVTSYKALAIIVLGGLGSIRGTLIASLGLGVIEAYGTIYIGHLLDRDAIAFLFLIVVLMLRPQGLMGQRA